MTRVFLRQTWHHLRHFPWVIISPVFLMLAVLILFGYWQFRTANEFRHRVDTLQQQQSLSNEEIASLGHLQLAEAEERQQLEAALREATSSAADEKQHKISEIYSLYKEAVQKIERNESAKLDVDQSKKNIAEWGELLLEQQFDELHTSIATTIDSLDKGYASYQASVVKSTPPTQPSTSQSGNNPAGYSSQLVQTSKGDFWTKLIKLPLNQVKVRTVSASKSDCSNNCPVKSLAQYVSDQGGFAGINGTYFCPPDYAHCAGKTNTFDFAFYNSSTDNWLNQNALTWDSEGLAIFNGSTAQFYRYARDWGGSAVTAGIANFPPLLVYKGSVVISDDDLDSYQKVKGTRGALGVGSGNIYLAVISGASITDAAHVMKALGATDVLNLDGGGSTALYIAGQYKAGPGRLLPNAVVLTR